MECVRGTVQVPAVTNQVGVEGFGVASQLILTTGCREQIAGGPARQQVNGYPGDGDATEVGRVIIRRACGLPLTVLPQRAGEADQCAGAHAGSSGLREIAVDRGGFRIIAVPKLQFLPSLEDPCGRVTPGRRIRVVQQPLLGNGPKLRSGADTV